MFAIKGIDHLNLNVKSLKLSKEFYKKVFDLDEKESGKSKLCNNYSIIGKKMDFISVSTKVLKIPSRL